MCNPGKNRRTVIGVCILGCCVILQTWAQHLPRGTIHENRERTYDILHLKADLEVDWNNKRVFGQSTITLKPLVACSLIAFDAHMLNVTGVSVLSPQTPCSWSLTDTSLTVCLDRMYQPDDTVSIVIRHSATPTAGFYFMDPMPGRSASPSAYTYGEGGLHANWLPIYADVNDKFSSEMSVTVPERDVVISNGKLVEQRANGNGTRTFHWLQELPHANYLIALYIGEYDSVQLTPALGTVPLSVWVPSGYRKEGRYAFRSTPRMVEFFSERFQYRYPWDKYDQIVVADYSIGAMENTGVTGLRDYMLRTAAVPDEANPVFDMYSSHWSAEELIAHELAHHWFGDNVTCRSLASIWLNEGFATYAHMLWDEQSGGEELLQFKAWYALQSYLTYVSAEHIIRPLEYRRYDTVDEMYNEEHTYLKGALVLHMLRWILGDDTFFGSLGYYLRKHQFGNVESSDFKTAIEERSGRNLQWFFDDWVYGGGHPRFEVSYRYHADRGIVDLTIHQIQPLIDGQGLFSLPVEIRIDTRSGILMDTMWVRKETEHFTRAVDGKPRMVSVDGRGALVCELLFEKELPELVYQIQHDALPGCLWALHQLADRHAANPRALAALRSLLGGSAGSWLKAETALQLGNFHTQEAVEVLVGQLTAADYRVRKAAVLALGKQFTPSARESLRRVISLDPAADVAATAIVSLAAIDSSVTPDFLQEQMNRGSWYDELRIASLVAMKKLARQEFVPLIKSCSSLRYTMAVREEVMNAWVRCAPDDPELHEVLLSSAHHEVSRLRELAITLLSDLKIEAALPLLETLAHTDGDGDIRKMATDAIDEIRRVSLKK